MLTRSTEGDAILPTSTAQCSIFKSFNSGQLEKSRKGVSRCKSISAEAVNAVTRGCLLSPPCLSPLRHPVERPARAPAAGQETKLASPLQMPRRQRAREGETLVTEFSPRLCACRSPRRRSPVIGGRGTGHWSRESGGLDACGASSVGTFFF